MTEKVLLSGKNRDAFLGGRIQIMQPEKGYRAGMDAVLLAASFQKTRENSFVLDAGCGVGTVMLCAASAFENTYFIGIDKDRDVLEYARENIQLNGANNQVRCYRADFSDQDCIHSVLDFKKQFFQQASLSRRPKSSASPQQVFSSQKLFSFQKAFPASAMGSLFDQILANPPYFEDQKGTRMHRGSAKEKAFICDSAKVEDWIRVCLGLLKPRGQLTMIYRADGLETLLKGFRGQAGDIHIKPVYAYQDRVAKRILIGVRKGISGTTTFLPPLILHSSERGRYTREADAILRGEKPLSLW